MEKVVLVSRVEILVLSKLWQEKCQIKHFFQEIKTSVVFFILLKLETL